MAQPLLTNSAGADVCSTEHPPMCATSSNKPEANNPEANRDAQRHRCRLIRRGIGRPSLSMWPPAYLTSNFAAIVVGIRRTHNCGFMDINISNMNTSFDWALVRSFLAVLDQGTLLAAARDLHTSQPTISRHLAELEQQLGLTLFDRTGRGLVPTDAAARIADSARAMQSAADQFALGARGNDRSASGTVRITASQPVACFVLPALLANMRQALPDIQVELMASNAVSNLLRREADIAIRMVQPEQSSLIARRVGSAAVRACAHQTYLNRMGMPRQTADLLSHDLIAGDRDDRVVQGFAAQGLRVTRDRLVLRTDDLIAAWGAVRAGLGVGFVVEHLIRTDPAVVMLLPKLKIKSLPVWLAVHREIRTSRRIRAVYDFLSDALPGAMC
ncbi:MAG: LysR family transcriptional regulator [Gammaproteobacteria bacterium]